MSLLGNSSKETRAVAYYRHSAEDKQENSVPLQREQARQFAKENSLQIIHEEADEGKSGLQANRPGFQRIFQDWILNTHAPHFKYVLALDVSRWGRFQDQDEAGHYEFICRQAGKHVIYINQGLPSEENYLIGSLRTSLERYMAAEYSRQLSDKVFRGAVEVTHQGFSAGGPPPYGMARLLIDNNKKPIRILKPGEHKQIANERVKFIPAQNRESEIVKKIFQGFVREDLSLKELAEMIRAEVSAMPGESTWNAEKVRRILKNQKYRGTLIYNQTSNRLKQGKERNPESEWIIINNALPALIERDLFDRAQKKLKERTTQYSRTHNAIDYARQIVRSHLKQLLSQEYKSKHDSHSFPPMIFSVTRKGNTREWCFVLPHQLRQQHHILAVGIRNPRTARSKAANSCIEELFLLPQHLFNPMMFVLLSEEEQDFQRYRINEEIFNRVALNMAAHQTTHARV